MVPVSVVIITKNKGGDIARCLNVARQITHDVIIVDNGSTDDTLAIARLFGCRVFHSAWYGYGANKNIGIEQAKYNWILSIDADEVPDNTLLNSLTQLDYNREDTVYDIRFKSYFGEKRVRFGSWGRDHHTRLFNRKLVKWTEPSVHETLLIPAFVKKKKLAGSFIHHSVKNVDDCTEKALYYARLSAEKYFKSDKRSNAINLYLSPLFAFIKTYILLLGFLDGKEGWHIAIITFKNRWLKYHCLNQLEMAAERKPALKTNFAPEY